MFFVVFAVLPMILIMYYAWKGTITVHVMVTISLLCFVPPLGVLFLVLLTAKELDVSDVVILWVFRPREHHYVVASAFHYLTIFVLATTGFWYLIPFYVLFTNFFSLMAFNFAIHIFDAFYPGMVDWLSSPTP